jgi:hypothetical protein
VTNDSNQYDFQAFQGFRRFDNRAWPSLHSATAFAAGAALVGEIRDDGGALTHAVTTT